MFELKPRRDNDERVDLINKMFQPFNELFDQGASVIESRFASFKADVKKVGNKYLVEAELPGFKKQEISIDYNQNYLTIHAEKEITDEVNEEGKVIRSERHKGESVRRFYVSGIDEDEIKAELDNGVLYIELPIKESEEGYSKRIEIK